MSDLDILELQDSENVKNTFYRYPKISPHLTKFDNHYEIKTIDNQISIYKIEEIILYIIADFKFAPIWLIQQWFEDYNKNGYEIIENWIKVGIVWAEPSSMGVFIRPTKFLFDLMEIDDTNYRDIPFGLLNHTCAEEQIVFDLSMGNNKSELWNLLKADKLLPCYHPLKIQVAQDTGTFVIREEHFKINHFKPQEIKDEQDKLIQSIKTSNNNFTLEFQGDGKGNYPLFTLVNYTDKGIMVTQKPDTIIPIPRLNGQPQSCSIELELSAKTPQKYEQIMKNYKNNLIYGKLFYLCGNNRIAKLVTDAYKSVGGLGSCRLFIIPFVAPAQRLSNFNLNDEEAQKKMLKLTIKNTKGSKLNNGE